VSRAGLEPATLCLKVGSGRFGNSLGISSFPFHVYQLQAKSHLMDYPVLPPFLIWGPQSFPQSQSSFGPLTLLDACSFFDGLFHWLGEIR